jgi:lipoate-protein ligase A
MKTIINRNTDPFFNLALEEYLLKHIKLDEDLVLFWRNEPSIIVGRNQNPFEEINREYLINQTLPIIRRISGGGTVFHDLGNLNYTFITSDLQDSLSNYKKFTKPIIDALNKLGIPAYFREKSDILVQGMKISGNAQSYHQNRMLHHGTILFESDVDLVYQTLHTNTLNALSKGIKSNRSKVVNISTFLSNQMNIEDFQLYLLQSVLGVSSTKDHIFTLTNHDLEQIMDLSKNKYQTWKWNFGETPEFKTTHQLSYNNKEYIFNLTVTHGLIQKIQLTPNNDLLLNQISMQLIGKPYHLMFSHLLDLI